MTDDRRCLVVDKHEVVRMGVRGLLSDGFEVEEASCWTEAVEAMSATGSFDVAVVELDPRAPLNGDPVGPAMIRALRKAMPGTGIVALAPRAERHAAKEAIGAGATAFVAKSSPTTSLARAVASAIEADRFIDPAADQKCSRLTRRQRQILQFLADGVSTKDVAHRLGLSAETVRAHIKAILARLEASDRAHAVGVGMRNGLIE